MTSRLTDQQKQTWVSFREFADEFIAPEARAADEQQVLSRDLIKKLGSAGWLSSLLPGEWGGSALDMVSYGLMAEEMGRTCQNVRNFVACADMVSHSIWKWGSQEQKDRWLKGIGSGEVIAAFSLTEPKVGSDAKSVQTEARPDGPDIVLRGVKKWISFGGIADVFLVFAQYEGRHTAFLVERETPGLRVEALPGLLGLRGSSLGEISFDDCRIPASSMVGRPGSGLVFVASSALDIGRFSTAWGCVGLAQACLEEASGYAREREQYGTAIIDHQLVQRMLADMLTGATASRLMCLEAGLVKDAGGMDAVNRTLMAKYFASTTANRVAADAVQVLGAYGIGGDSPVARLFRDAKVMEIIEGTTQLHQSMLGDWSAQVPHPAGTSTRPL